MEEIARKNKLLEVFVGRWNTTGEVAASSDSQPLEINAIDTYEWLPGEYALIHYADGWIGKDKIHSVEVIGYDAVRQAYYGPFFDDQGGAGFEEIRVDGKTWTWHGKNVMGVKYHRCIATFSEDGNILNARHEQSEDGDNWQTWMDVQLVKEK